MSKALKTEISKLRPADDKKISKAELSILMEKIAALISKHPDKAAIILTDWLKK